MANMLAVSRMLLLAQLLCLSQAFKSDEQLSLYDFPGTLWEGLFKLGKQPVIEDSYSSQAYSLDELPRERLLDYLVSRLEEQTSQNEAALRFASWTPQIVSAPDNELSNQVDTDESAPLNDPSDFELVFQPKKEGERQTATLRRIVHEAEDGLKSSRQMQSVDQPSTAETNSKGDGGELDGSSNQPAKVEDETASSSSPNNGGSEYIDHPLALVGHQYVQGGAGEGRQLLGPDGSFENVQVIKSDHAMLSYCDPPNPCPLGYTAEDGCLENFVNSASFSREYQAKQECPCDNEHSLFNCAAPITTANSIVQDNNVGETGEHESDSFMGKLTTLARVMQNRFGSLSSLRNLIARHEESEEDATDVKTTGDRLDRVAKKAPKLETDFRY